MRFMVRGARGVVPAAKLGWFPANARRAARGFVYQLGENLLWRRLMRRYRPASRKRMVEVRVGNGDIVKLARWLF